MWDIVVSAVVSVLTEVGKCLAAPIGRKFGYVRNYKTNLDSLKQEAKKLTEERERVQHRVDAAERNGELIEQNVQTWLTSVDDITVEAGKIIEDEEKAKSLCFKGLCPNVKSRYELSRNAEEKAKAITQLLEEAKFDHVSYKTIPREIWLPDTVGYGSFESRMETLNDIQNALSDPNVNIIGVYGMGGIGKTTLVKEIAMKAEDGKLFDEVVFAHVSQNVDIKKIQGEIADKLSLEFREETESGRARKLRERLSREKKILVILDNIWTRVELDTIGIPLGNDHKGCKLLLTARSLDVLSINMSRDRNFQVGILNEKEAWSLFKNIAGDDCINNIDLQCIATDVVKECGGLPIAIVTIARALHDQSIAEWKNALRELRKPSKSNFTGVQKEAYSTIELSYNHLNDELKSIFLLCSTMIDNALMLDLLKYSMGLGLLQGSETLEEARDKLYTLVRKLKASCLLLDGQTSEQFSMHDVIRDVALSIASRDQHVFTVREESASFRWPKKGTLESCTAIVYTECNISEFVEGLECPRLKFFNIWSKNIFLKMHKNFFAGMTELKVLDLTRIRLSSLPSSIRLLGNLRTLCLDQSELGDIAIIGELKNLEILSFISSDIGQLPKELGELSCLKLLDLSNCNKLKFVPPNVISSLSQLEELYMGNTFVQWDNEGSNNERRNASLHELKHLSHLTNLEIHLKDVQSIPVGLFSKNLQRYKIFVGDGWVWSPKYEGTRTLKLKVNANMRLEDEVTMQLKKIEVLYLDEVQGTDNVLYGVDKEGFPQLKYLHVQNNPYFRCILDSMKWVPQEPFPQLESFVLSNLINMEKICYSKLTGKSFCKLKTIKVDNCDKLKNIFWLSIVKSLPQLKTVEVTECKAMEEIFAVGREDDVNNNEALSKIELDQIRSLTLKSLPHLTSFCSEVKIPEDEHDTPTALFNEMVLLPNLEALEVSAINCEKIWQNQLSEISSCFRNLTRLIVQECGNLEYLFSSSIARSFVKLQHLEVRKCPVLKEILVIEESREEERKSFVFPQLNFLKLEDLESLTTFCLGYDVEFSSLKQLEIKQCPKFKAFVLENLDTDSTTGNQLVKMSSLEVQPFFHEKVAFPELEEMAISNLYNLKMIWDNKLAQDSFSKLKLITIEGCNELLTLFPYDTFKRFPRLESLTIGNCGSLEEIFGLQELNFEEMHSTFVVQLKLVNVSNCQSLKNIFQASIAKSLRQLERLEIWGCGVLTEIVAKEQGTKTNPVRFVFPKVSHLELTFLPNLTTFYPGVHASEWQVLERLAVADCENVKVFALEMHNLQKTNDEGQLNIPAQQPLFLGEKVIPKLKFLKLDIKDIMMICHGQFARNHFSTLDTLIVREDGATVFSLGLLQRFSNLKALNLCYGSYKEIFSHEDVEKHGKIFERIRSLWLVSLSHLKRIWREDSKLNSILRHLERLEVNYCDSLNVLVPPSATFKNLTTLIVYYCKGMKNLVTSSTAKSLENLKYMEIEGCQGMIEIVANEGDVGEDEIVFNKLEHLSLNDLESLISFCSTNCRFSFLSMYSLIVRDCPKMKIFCEGVLSTTKLNMVCQNWEDWRLDKGHWEGDLNTTIQQLHHKTVELRNLENLEVPATDFEKIWQNQSPEMTSRFQNLKRLIVHGNGKLTYLFSPSIVESFLQLQHLEICKCSALSEIISMEEERKYIMFPQLNFLKIEHLENLTRFCSKNYIEFPSLKILEIKQCPEFKAFVLKNLDTDLTAGEVGNMNSKEILTFFANKVAFPSLEKMMISHLANVEALWNENLPHHSFGKLKLMEVEGCNDLVTLFPSNMLGRFTRLESLTINDCASLEEIFRPQGINFETGDLPPVNKLKLVSVSNCKSLKNIFQASIAKTLLQLEQLHIRDCGVLREIVAMEQGVEASAVRFVFPKVSSMKLLALPELSAFYPGEHISEWPMLEELRIRGCQKVKLFASKSLDFEITGDKGQLGIPTQPSLFFIEKISPRLEVLQLRSKDIMMICHSQFNGHPFSKLNILIIREDEAVVFALGLIERFYNMRMLTLARCSYKVLFSNEEVEQHSRNLARIKCLRLEYLSNLMHMWKQDSKLNSVLQNLEVLDVDHCDSLISLVPCSASFQNLTTLIVYYCKGMINLVSYSTAKSLKRLKKMSIEGCQRLRDIIANEEDVAGAEIVLDKLEELSLVGLESLSSFCSVNYPFNFPSLDVLIMRDCPEMKIFCAGALSTSRLEMVCQNREDWRLDKGCWEGDLNTTIQRLHHNMNVQNSIGDAIL